MKVNTLRFRMMFLFCTVVGVLLAGSYLAFWGLLAREVHTQFNRQLLETARPIIADLIAEPDPQDIARLDIPGEFFELLDTNGQVVQHSRNLSTPINLVGMNPNVTRPTFGMATIGNGESVRLALIPFQQANRPRVLAVAIPTLGTNRVVDSFLRVGRAADGRNSRRGEWWTVRPCSWKKHGGRPASVTLRRSARSPRDRCF